MGLTPEQRAEAARLYTAFLINIRDAGGDSADVLNIKQSVEDDSKAFVELESRWLYK